MASLCNPLPAALRAGGKRHRYAETKAARASCRAGIAAVRNTSGVAYPAWRSGGFHTRFALAEPEVTDTDGASPPRDFDSPWKEALEQYFDPAMALLAPALHARVDWTRPVQFLDKEFQALSHRLPSGRQMVDKLARVHGRDGSPLFILIHVEVQSERARPKAFNLMAERMTFYMFRIRDRFRQDFASGRMALFSQAIFTRSADGPPLLRHGWEFEGCSASFQCPAIHLGQWWSRWDELEAAARTNPFAVVIMAQLLAHKHGAAKRLEQTTRLVRLLFQYHYPRDAILSVLRLITWMIALPPGLEPTFEKAIQNIEREYTMPYLMGFERRAMAAGREEGKKEGKADGMLAILQRLLSLKFGPLPEWADARLKQADTDTLTLWSERILFTDTLDEVFKTQS